MGPTRAPMRDGKKVRQWPGFCCTLDHRGVSSHVISFDSEGSADDKHRPFPRWGAAIYASMSYPAELRGRDSGRLSTALRECSELGSIEGCGRYRLVFASVVEEVHISARQITAVTVRVGASR
jgi:hypothetical protein